MQPLKPGKDHTYVISQYCDVQNVRQHLESYQNMDIAQPYQSQRSQSFRGCAFGAEQFATLYKLTQRAIILPCSLCGLSNKCPFLSRIKNYNVNPNASDQKCSMFFSSVFSQRRDMTSSSCSQYSCALNTMLALPLQCVVQRFSMCHKGIVTSCLAFVGEDRALLKAPQGSSGQTRTSVARVMPLM